MLPLNTVISNWIMPRVHIPDADWITKETTIARCHQWPWPANLRHDTCTCLSSCNLPSQDTSPFLLSLTWRKLDSVHKLLTECMCYYVWNITSIMSCKTFSCDNLCGMYQISYRWNWQHFRCIHNDWSILNQNRHVRSLPLLQIQTHRIPAVIDASGEPNQKFVLIQSCFLKTQASFTQSWTF